MDHQDTNKPAPSGPTAQQPPVQQSPVPQTPVRFHDWAAI